MAAAEMWRLDRAVIFGVLTAVATANCGGESKTDLNDQVGTGGKSSSAGAPGTGGAATGGAKPTGGTAMGGAKASGGTVSTFGGSLSTAGMPATGGTTGGKSTGGATATGGEPSASGGSATGGAAVMGGRAAMGGRPGTGGDGTGGGADLPDDSCLEGCEVAAQTPLCGERLTWVCFGAVSEKLQVPECEDAATQVPRFCCTRDFRPCE
jgi:hypothetical protein